jgi:hypothetical protein
MEDSSPLGRHHGLWYVIIYCDVEGKEKRQKERKKKRGREKKEREGGNLFIF